MSLVRILVVDDETDVRKSVRMTLTKAGYDVVEAAWGGEDVRPRFLDQNYRVLPSDLV